MLIFAVNAAYGNGDSQTVVVTYRLWILRSLNSHKPYALTFEFYLSFVSPNHIFFSFLFALCCYLRTFNFRFELGCFYCVFFLFAIFIPGRGRGIYFLKFHLCNGINIIQQTLSYLQIYNTHPCGMRLWRVLRYIWNKNANQNCYLLCWMAVDLWF